MKKLLLSIIAGSCLLFQGCNYLDIVPDNIATLDHSFANDVTTQKYLFTCYAGLPSESDINTNPGFLSGDEYWSWEGLIGYTEFNEIYYPWMIARGQQNTNSPYLNAYEGGLWQTIRKCNTFIERVDHVKGLREVDAKQWKAEAKTIKSYCHFYLMRMYGPIPILKENSPIDAPSDAVKFKRNTWDECVNYVVSLLDEATPDLPLKIGNRMNDLGRMTQAITATLKAKILVTSASPQFNGNSYYAEFRNKDGQALFGPKDNGKWKIAADACKEAIDICEKADIKLYEYKAVGDMKERVKYEYTIRGSVTEKEWSSELIWGSVIGPGTIQKFAQAYLNPDKFQMGGHIHLVLGVPMKIAKQYYTSNGVPMEEDKTWVGKNYEKLRTSEGEDLDVIRGTTAEFNFNREPRFYASLGFDTGVWYGAGQPDNNPFVVKGLYLQVSNNSLSERSCITGYWAKKLINVNSYQQDKTSYTATAYAWPILRLPDLYLLYAEALNESQEQPTEEIYHYVDLVRQRAGLSGVKASWTQFSSNPDKPNSKDGMREIIQRERLIELSLEGQRFWDLRRWLLSTEYFTQPITAWNRTEKTTEDYYHEVTLALQTFTARDYLWPISISLLNKNSNLVQTIGWE